MATLGCHAVITEDNQSCLVIHLFNDSFYYVFYIVHFTLEFCVFGAISMTSVIHANKMGNHELEVRAIFENFVNILRSLIIVEVQLSYILILKTLFEREPFAKILHPDIFAKENGTCLFFKLFMQRD